MGTTWVNKTVDFGDKIIFVGGDSTISSLNKLTVETTGSTKSIILNATGDIELNPTGADITIAGVSGGAGKLTIGGTSLTVYGGDTTGDDLILYPNTVDTATEYIKLLGAASIDILSTTKINLDGAVDISGDVTLDTAGTTGITLGAVNFTTGISITSTNLTDGIKVSGTTPVDGIEVSSACSANGIHVSGICDDGIEISGTCGTAGLNISGLGAAGTGIIVLADVSGNVANAKAGVSISKDLVHNSGTTARANTNEALLVESVNTNTVTFASTVANDLVKFYVNNDADAAGSDVWSGNVLALQYDATVTTAGTATSSASALSIDYNLTETATTLNIDPFSVIDIDYDTSGTPIYATGTANMINVDLEDAGTPVYTSAVALNGLHVDAGSVADAANLTLCGIKVTMPATYGANAVERAAYFAGDTSVVSICDDNVTGVTITAGAGGTGEIVLADVTEANNAITGLNISKDLTYSTAVGAVAQTNGALLITSVNATSASADSILTVANTLVDISETNSTAIASADVYSGFVTGIAYTASTSGTGTATSSATALNIDYNLTLGAGTLSADSFSVFNIDYDVSGAVTYNAGTFNMINVDMDDDAVPGHTASTIMNGLQINTEGIDVTDGDLTLNGIKVTMPAAYDAATEYAGYFTGDGATVSVCADDSVGLSVSSAATTGNPVSIACNTITSGSLLNVTSTSAVSATGELANFDHTSSGANIFSVQTDSPFVTIDVSRTDSGTATATENYDVVSISRTNNNSAAGTMTLAGSVLKLSNVATDSGTMTNNINVLEIVNTNTTVDTDQTGGISLSGVENLLVIPTPSQATYFMDCGAAGGFLVTGTGAGNSLKDSTAADILCDGHITIDINNTSYYIPIYDTLA